MVILIIVYMSSQQAARDRDTQLQIASMGTTQPQANAWSSIGDAAGIINALGGLFGSGGGDIQADPGPRLKLRREDDEIILILSAIIKEL